MRQAVLDKCFPLTVGSETSCAAMVHHAGQDCAPSVRERIVLEGGRGDGGIISYDIIVCVLYIYIYI